MKTLIMLCGVPGTGKSTWAKEYAAAHPNTLIVDTDEVRKSFTGSYQVFPPDRHILYDEMIKRANDWFLKMAKEKDATVIEDSTFTDNYRRIYYMDRINGYDRAKLLMIRMHDYSICYQRNKMRPEEKWVPEQAIADFIAHYEAPSPEVLGKFNEVEVQYWD